ncbi:MAG TPA: inositol monophosphatase family protein [Dissulfurispiraceae bacterium]|nr:inositol monophosphatase family protein [Dissulfurispiraceae bacterium]
MMINDEKKDFLAVAVSAAERAGELILRHLGTLKRSEIDNKEAADYVTAVDRASEQLIIDTIRSRFPDHRILAEESLHEEDDDGYRWIIDPLDGTTNYIHSIPVFGVSIALQHRGRIIAGVVYDPRKQECFTALRGGGAYLNGSRIAVPENVLLADALIATGFPFKQRELIDPYLQAFRRIFLQVSDLRRAGAAALDLAYVACGRCEGFFEIGLKTWDAAAGSILIREAGGVITDFGGGTDYLYTGNIVAGAPPVHAALLEEVRAVFAEIVPK